MANETNMIAACPKCRARYRIEAGQLKSEGVRLRCSQCDAVFRVTPPAAAPPREIPPQSEAPQPEAAQPAPPQPEREAVAPSHTDAPQPDAEPPCNGGPIVVVADSDIEAGKQTAQALAEWGYAPVLVHDGVEAILTIQRSLPQAVVLDAGLTKMFGFQVCELMKRNESLSSIQVVLVGAIHHEARYRREPSELYGADAYLERPQLPEALRAVLRGFGLVAGGRQAQQEAPRRESPVEPPAELPRTEPPLPEPPRTEPPLPEPPRSVTESDSARGLMFDDSPSPGVGQPSARSPEPAPPVHGRRAGDAVARSEVRDESDERAAARRLARIIVSDIVLYNAEKFDAGVRAGDVLGELAPEIAEGRGLLAQRVSAQLRDECDFVAEELVRVARARGMSD